MITQDTEAVSEQLAHEIGIEAYIYLYPLVTMDVTRKQMTSFEVGALDPSVKTALESVWMPRPADSLKLMQARLPAKVLDRSGDQDGNECSLRSETGAAGR